MEVIVIFILMIVEKSETEVFYFEQILLAKFNNKLIGNLNI